MKVQLSRAQGQTLSRAAHRDAARLRAGVEERRRSGTIIRPSEDAVTLVEADEVEKTARVLDAALAGSERRAAS